jgi:UDP-N-acetylmuramoyl-tripeptide--D-alanyl-D-alanine ligase
MFQLVGYKTGEFRSFLADRFFSHVITSEHILISILITVLVTFFAEDITLTAAAILLGVFVLFWFIGISDYKAEREKKPLVFTARMKRVSGFILILLIGIWYSLIEIGFISLLIRDFAAPFIKTDPYFMAFSLVFVDICVPFLVWLGGWVLKPVEWKIQNGFKKQARKKLASLPNLKVIAITGSYGKTSTKFAIDAFLKERYSVCVTPGSFNTPMGICKVINNDLKASHNVLILEMGARYKGNIGELCDIAQPSLSVVTNVGLAHLETFGSQDVIAREKSTIVRRLTPNGTAILNGDDPRVEAMGKLRNDVRVVYTGNEGSITAADFTVNSNGTSFTMIWKNQDGSEQSRTRVQTKLLGEHNVQNILLAAAVAREFEIRIETAALAASKMEPVEHRLELKHRNGLTIIDDAFNSNPIGAKNALDVLSSFESGKKIVITPGMIELGEREDEMNEEFGRQIARSRVDVAILVGAEQTKAIQMGIESENAERHTEVHVVKSLFEANDLLNSVAVDGDVVLYENDLPDNYG